MDIKNDLVFETGKYKVLATNDVVMVQCKNGRKEASMQYESFLNTLTEKEVLWENIAILEKEIERLREENKKLLGCVEYFIKRVQGIHPDGLIRSKKTYEYFVKTLQEIKDGK